MTKLMLEPRNLMIKIVNTKQVALDCHTITWLLVLVGVLVLFGST